MPTTDEQKENLVDPRGVRLHEPLPEDESGGDLAMAAEVYITDEVAELRIFLSDALESLPGLSQDRGIVQELEEIQRELNRLEESFLSRVGVFVSSPAEFLRRRREKKREEALSIPDNPKIIRELRGEINEIRELIQKREKRFLQQLRDEFPDRDVKADVSSFEEWHSQRWDLRRDEWRNEEAFGFQRWPTRKFTDSKITTDVGLRYRALVYNQETQSKFLNIATTYHQLKKEESGVQGRIYFERDLQRGIEELLEVACSQGDLNRIIVLWEKSPEQTPAFARRIVEMTIRSYVIENILQNENDPVRPDFAERKAAVDTYFFELTEAFANVPMLKEMTEKANRYFYHEMFSQNEMCLLDNYGIEIMDQWSILGEQLQKELLINRFGFGSLEKIALYKYALGLTDQVSGEDVKAGVSDPFNWVSTPICWQLYKRERGSVEVANGLKNRLNVYDYAEQKYSGPHASKEIIDETLKKFFALAETRPDPSYWADDRVLRVVLNRPKDFQKIKTALDDIPPLSAKIATGVINNFEKLVYSTPEHRRQSIAVMEAIANSPSQEIQRIVESLVEQILATENPLEAFKKVEDIFIKNNLPLVGKIFKIFEALYPPAKLGEVLDKNYNLSPYLRKASPKRRTYTIFTDLLRVHVDSGNRSLRQYLELLKEGEALFTLLDETSDDSVPPAQIKKLKHFVAKLNTIFLNSQLGGMSEGVAIEGDVGMQEVRSLYTQLKVSLGVKSGQRTGDRIAELFLQPLGYTNLDEALNAMESKKRETDNRSRRMVAGARGGALSLKDGDLVKGVEAQYIASILQNGSVAKEYLGASSDSDKTPFDTDLERLSLGNIESSRDFESIVNNTVAKVYGEIMLVVRNRGQYAVISSDTSLSEYSTDKYELFKSGVVSEEHFGIRTGFASTEIDFIICKQENSEDQKKLFLEIAKNGYYLPVTNKSGKVIFTPEMYDTERKIFAGIDRFDGGTFPFQPTQKHEKHAKDIEKNKSKIKNNKEQVAIASRHVREVIEEVVMALDVSLKEAFDTNLLGAELIDTGSTGRHTNIPGNFDFDLVLKIDHQDEAKVATIVAALKEKLRPVKDESHDGNSESDLYQLRFFGANVGQGDPLDIDIAFVKKSELLVYGSHDAVKDKLTNIKETAGEDAYETVLANIVLAKEILKKGGAYKKLEHGGLGGIGVENWVLAHGGNMIRAFETFRAAAYQGKKRRTLSEFKEQYPLVDPGINLKSLKHGDFVQLLTESGYKNMLQVIEDYLR